MLFWCKPVRTIRKKKFEICSSLVAIYVKVFILMLVCLLALCSELCHMLPCPIFAAIITSYPSPNTHTLSIFHVSHSASFWYFVKYLWQGSRCSGSKTSYNAPSFVSWVCPYPKYHYFKITGEVKWNTNLMQHCAGFISAESLYMFRTQAPIIRSI